MLHLPVYLSDTGHSDQALMWINVDFRKSSGTTKVNVSGGVIPVCIFAKPPIPAEVKTRLIPALGPVAAAELAGAMLLDVWRTVESCPGVRPILATTRHGDFPFPVSPGDFWLQGDGGLGQRIERILNRGLLQAPAAMAVGADSPALTVAHLEAALDTLERNDLVVGPSTDGGFYLLGLRRSQGHLFSSVPWSSSQTLQVLKRRIQEYCLSFAELEPLFDVDTPSDLLTLEQHLRTHPSLAPATAAWWYRNRTRGHA
ncbi:MAG TPA: TIGR04282 family arsenosugar biosynthesis glycosyltransferase [Bryobacteraceae bacterium]|nr:TIGR04282 family arsenosugar biosynthesis glycosyltransferase [Bryobacteraceae bacterium]